MELRIHEFDLPLRHTFTIARGSINQQKTLIAELIEGQFRGYGEATTNDYYGFTFQNMAEALERVRPVLAQQKLEDPTKLWEACASLLRDNPFAQCALDQAAHDLWGKMQGQPVYRLWGLGIERTPPSNYTIGIDSIDKMVEKMNEFPGWPIYKIKLGTKEDLNIVRALRRHTQAIFRVDANCGWTVEQTISNSRSLREFGVEFIEQPLPADQWEGMKRVYAESALPIIADESCIVETDVARCAGSFHGINIKLVKCGGLTPARRMIADARQRKMKVMVGCMTESSVGISAIAQLLPLLDYVDMDGAVLLAKDIATGVTVKKGVCQFPSVNGNGVTLIA